MHFIRVAYLRPRLVAYGGNRVGIEPAQILGAIRRVPATILHGLGAALFQWRVIEERVRCGIQHFGGERARAG